VSASVTVLPEARKTSWTAASSSSAVAPTWERRLRPKFWPREVLAALDRIGALPELYGEVGPGIRAAGVKRFGYVVDYRIGPGGVEALAVLHGGRDSRIWQSRASQ
jgi:plasmid stabilization system protein ParE